MKTLTLRLNDDDHARLQAAASKERMPMVNYLMRLFDKQEAAKPVIPAQKIGNRDRAFLDYEEIMDNLPTNWTQELRDSTVASIKALRIRGGNLSNTEMPMPEAMNNWSYQKFMADGAASAKAGGYNMTPNDAPQTLPKSRTPEEDAELIALGITFDDDE